MKVKMVYTDKKHLVSNDIDELYQFAQSIGLKPEWFQEHRHPHYDLMGCKIQQAIDAGAVVVSTRILIDLATGKLQGFWEVTG